MQAEEEKKKAVEPPKQVKKTEKITRGAHKGEEREVIVEEFGMYLYVLSLIGFDLSNWHVCMYVSRLFVKFQ